MAVRRNNVIVNDIRRVMNGMARYELHVNIGSAYEDVVYQQLVEIREHLRIIAGRSEQQNTLSNNFQS